MSKHIHIEWKNIAFEDIFGGEIKSNESFLRVK